MCIQYLARCCTCASVCRSEGSGGKSWIWHVFGTLPGNLYLYLDELVRWTGAGSLLSLSNFALLFFLFPLLLMVVGWCGMMWDGGGDGSSIAFVVQHIWPSKSSPCDMSDMWQHELRKPRTWRPVACLHLSLCVLQASFANDTFLSKALRFGFGSLKSWNPYLANPCLSRLIPFQELCSPRCGSCHKACALLATQAFVTLAPIIISLGCTVMYCGKRAKVQWWVPSVPVQPPNCRTSVLWSELVLLSLVHSLVHSSCSQLNTIEASRPMAVFVCHYEVTHDLDDRLQKECETEITILQMLDHPNLWLGSCVFALKLVRKTRICQLKPLSLFFLPSLSLSHICI